MLEDLINRQRQALAQFLRRSKRFTPINLKLFLTGKLRRKKPSLMVAIGKRRRVDALQEYRRRFASTAGQGVTEKPPAGHDAKLERTEKAKRIQIERRDQRDRLRAKVRWSGGSNPSGRNWVFLLLALLRSYHALASIRLKALISVVMACAITLGVAHGYRIMMAGSEDLSGTEFTGQLSQGPSGLVRGEKLYSGRLTADGADSPIAPPAQPDAAERDVKDQPTFAQSENSLPDGTRTETVQPAAVPSIVSYLEPAKRPEAMAEGEALQPKDAHAEGPAVQPAAEPIPSALDRGYFVQVKADQDRKAAEAALTAFLDSYKSVLGEIPLITRLADLKEKGIWFRVLAGPIKSRDEAASLCKKLKTAGLQACIVQKFD